MSPRQRIEIRQSEIREEVAGILGQETRSDEDREKLANLTTELRGLEVEHRAAIVSDPEPETETRETPAGETPEDRELEELRSGFSVGRLLHCLAGRGTVTGREAEYLEHRQLSHNQIPLNVWETPPETRAATPSPDTADRAMRPIVPAIFDQSVAPFLGIEIPMVGTGDAAFPILSTSLTADAKEKGEAAPETAGAFTVKTASPRRVTGSFLLQVEDTARLAGMEQALRNNLSAVLADKVDDRIINGTASGDGTIHGLLAQLTDPTANFPASGAPGYADFLKAAASLIDGKQAVDEAGVSVLFGLETYRIAAATVWSSRDRTAARALREFFGGCRASGRMPAASSNVQSAIGVRQRVGMPNAAMPVWDSMTIRDIYSGAGEGQITVTAFVLTSDVVILRSGGYVQLGIRTAP